MISKNSNSLPRVKITRVTEEGNENVLCVRGSGALFCPLPFLDSGNELGTAIAMTDVVLWRIDKEQFLFLASNNPNLLAYVQRDCLFEVRNLVRRMEKVAFKNVYQRLASAIVDLLERQVTKGGSRSELKIKHHDLAGIIGASRESVSRSLSRLEKQHLLTTYRGRLVVHNIEKIKESIK
jgi:CRP/FNR family transcriptional regulator